MKSTCPTQTRSDHILLSHVEAYVWRLGSCWALGLALGPQGFLDTNILVLVTQKFHVGGHAQQEPPTQSGSRFRELYTLNNGTLVIRISYECTIGKDRHLHL